MVSGAAPPDPVLAGVRAALEAGEARLDGALLERALDAAERAGRSVASAEAAYLEARAALALVTWHQRRGAVGRAVDYAERAVTAGKTATERDRLHADAHRVVGEALGRLIALEGGLAGVLHGRRALNELALALRLEPTNARAHLAMGVARLRAPRLFGRDADEAVRSFERAITLAPETWEAWTWLGIARRERGEPVPARAALERALALSPHNDWVRAELAKLPR